MSKDGRPILLALDGGGAKGWSQLTFLHDIICAIIKKTKINDGDDDPKALEELKAENIYPCEYFDLIVGSGTGGINAILIGRLGLSIEQCREAWVKLGDVFKITNEGPGPLFSEERLEKWARELVKEHTGSEETMMLIKNDDTKPNQYGKTCRVGVTSMRAQNIGLPAVFRSYRVRANAGIDCTIWEVLRATTASPLLFKSVFIGRKWAKQEFINAELGANNPISYLFQEKQKVWLRKDNWPPPEIGCILSLGSGKDKVISLESEPTEPPKGYIGWATSYFTATPNRDLSEKLYDVMLRIAKDCEKKHEEIEASYGENAEKVYFRFNVEQGMQEVPEIDYDKKNRERIDAQVRTHVDHADHEELVEPFVDRMITLLGMGQGDEEAIPAYDSSSNPQLIEKAKGMARSLGATSD